MATKKPTKTTKRPAVKSKLAKKEKPDANTALLAERELLKQQLKQLTLDNEALCIRIRLMESKLEDSRHEIVSLEEDLEAKDNELKELQESIDDDYQSEDF